MRCKPAGVFSSSKHAIDRMRGFFIANGFDKPVQ
jgi:hypothetical protein